ncbi:MAG: leucyl aminopeptidase, partial [Acetobacter sp.]|nr:leucyl aminopeptidase [Acetobacter sp.]
MVEIVFASPNPSNAPVLALLEQEGGNRSELFSKVDGLTGGALTRAIEAGEFEFSHAKTLTLLAPSPEFSCIVLVGLGQVTDLTEVRVMEAAGEAALALSKYESAALNIAALPEKFGIDAVTGAALAFYRFDTYRTVSKDKNWKIGTLRILTEHADQIKAQWASASAVVRGVFMARDLASEPANILTPIAFAERAQALIELGVEVEVLDLAAMQKLGFGALLGVAQGSANEPRTVIMRWNGGKEGEAPVAFAGK